MSQQIKAEETEEPGDVAKSEEGEGGTGTSEPEEPVDVKEAIEEGKKMNKNYLFF